MIDENPKFVDFDANDLHLTLHSPCRDGGSADHVEDLFDFEGDDRALFGNSDMGADEFHPHPYCLGEFAPGTAVEARIVGFPNTSPVGLFIGSGVLAEPVPLMWGNWYLEAPWFVYPQTPIPGNGILELREELPATPPAPYDIPMQALIGDRLSNLFAIEVR